MQARAGDAMTTRTWQPFGIPDELADKMAADATVARRDGVRIVNLRLTGRAGDRAGRDRAASWLRNAMIALGVLAAAAAVVSFAAQYRLVLAAKHMVAVAALEAGIPDVGSMIFASLGIALALHGRRAVRARALNVACVGLSLGMNALAAGHGWRDLAIWVMPSAVYAVASDTLIGVIRAWTVARQHGMGEPLADGETTPLAVLAGMALWLLRLCVAPASTLSGLRAWVVEECPTAPGRRVIPAESPHPPLRLAASPATAQRARPGGKTARLLALAEKRHGPLASIPLDQVSRIATALAGEVDLHAGSARTALRARVLAAQNGGQR
jgi:hypothetical protein